jgi:hypothetical protein
MFFMRAGKMHYRERFLAVVRFIVYVICISITAMCFASLWITISFTTRNWALSLSHGFAAVGNDAVVRAHDETSLAARELAEAINGRLRLGFIYLQVDQGAPNNPMRPQYELEKGRLFAELNGSLQKLNELGYTPVLERHDKTFAHVGHPDRFTYVTVATDPKGDPIFTKSPAQIRPFEVSFPCLEVLAPVWAALGVLRAGLFFRARSRARRGLCLHCGYDLRGSFARCPECGIAIPGREGKAGQEGKTGRLLI